MAIVLNGTSGITNDSGYTGDGVSFADSTPANTLVTTSGGNVGIGTSSPTQRVQIGNPSDANQGMLLYFPDADNAAIYTTRFSTGSLQSLQVGAQNTLKFLTNATERARIDSSGNLLVGTTSVPSSSILGVRIAAGNTSFSSGAFTGLYTHISFINGNGTVGTIRTDGSATSYNTSSDYRLKNTIAPMTGALEKVALLKPVTYKWNADGSDGEGFIAHELAEVCPQAVTGEKDAVDADGNPVYQGIDTSFLVATLTAAIQEQQALINAQQAALESLTARVVALEGQAT